MSNYDFSTINDKEFEELVNDIIGKRDGQFVESYKQGRDQGIDGRSINNNGEVTIIQSKHWIKSGITPLIKELKRTEVDKVNKLNPDRYILATSLELSYKNKMDIKLAFTPYIKDIKDILGNEDVNSLLSQHEDIELKYYNLWINSTNVISRMFNNATHVRSKFKLEEIVSKSRFYVKTLVHDKSESTLNTNNIILITGNAGIGKTTLAEQMCKIYTTRGYSFYYILNSIDEIDGIYNKNQNQVYFYDDFLGSNYLKRIENKEDVTLSHLITRIRKDPSKKLILTTRTNIFEQSKLLTELFDRVKISTHEIQINAENLTRFEKAKILYNHIWFSDLTHEYREELTKDLRYFQVIDHVNFNPRLIEFVTDACRLDEVAPNDYWDYVIDTLRNPKDIWRHVFANQTNKLCNHLVVGMVLNGGRMTSAQCTEYFYRLLGSNLHPNIDESYETTIKLVIGSLLNRHIGFGNDVHYDLFNPSISDFVLGEYSKNIEYLSSIFQILKTERSLVTLQEYRSHKIITYEAYITCLKSLAKPESIYSKYDRILANLIVMVPNFNTISIFHEYLKGLSSTIFNYDLVNDEQLRVILNLIKFNIIDCNDENLHDFILSVLEENYDDIYFVELSQIMDKINILNDENFETLFENIHEYYEEELTNLVIDSDIFSDYYSITELSLDSRQPLIDFLSEDLSSLITPKNVYLSDLISDLVHLCDLEAVVEYNVERHDFSPSSSYGKSYGSGQNSFTTEITNYFRDKN
ncbi:Restriction endonuclease type IV Mrr domain-containing protein [Vibrio crassostreae]|nr:Restriction endonuclease type IV Mrr domain-containing protein [Vibrio crassostreae]